MPLLVQICIVAVSAAILAVCIAAIRAVQRFEKVADQVSETARNFTATLDAWRTVTQETHEIVVSLAGVAPRVDRLAAQFERVGQRALGLTSSLIDEIATPVGAAAAVLRGVRTGANALFERLAHRSPTTTHNGGIQE